MEGLTFHKEPLKKLTSSLLATKILTEFEKGNDESIWFHNST